MRQTALVTIGVFCALGCSEPPIGRAPQAIIGGETTGDFPAAGFVIADGFLCGGTVIAPRTIVTAAHCMFTDATPRPMDTMRFGLGTDIMSPTESFDVVEVTVHPEYVAGGTAIPHDLALLTLDRDVPVVPMPLLMEPVPIGSTATLVGYGREVSPGVNPSGTGLKRKVDVTIEGLREDLWYYDYVGGRGACTGDSGGPAFIDVGGQTYLAGTTAFADRNCTSRGNYTRIDTHLDFLAVGGGPTPTAVTMMGSVVDSQSGAGIGNVDVTIVENGQTTTSDASGAFSFSLLEGTYTVHGSAIGYQTNQAACALSAAAPSCVLMLSEVGAPPPPVTTPDAGMVDMMMGEGPTRDTGCAAAGKGDGWLPLFVLLSWLRRRSR